MFTIAWRMEHIVWAVGCPERCYRGSEMMPDLASPWWGTGEVGKGRCSVLLLSVSRYSSSIEYLHSFEQKNWHFFSLYGLLTTTNMGCRLQRMKESEDMLWARWIRSFVWRRWHPVLLPTQRFVLGIQGAKLQQSHLYSSCFLPPLSWGYFQFNSFSRMLNYPVVHLAVPAQGRDLALGISG